MQWAAIMVQKRYRILSARLLASAERRRRTLGPQVEVVFRRGVCIGGRTMTLVVKTCGGNYRLEGLDLVRNIRYEGLMLSQEVERLVETYNKSLKVGMGFCSRKRITRASDFRGNYLENTISSICVWEIMLTTCVRTLL